MKAIHLKSFDYRVLNLLLYQLRGEKVKSYLLFDLLLALSKFMKLTYCTFSPGNMHGALCVSFHPYIQ